ncbi:MAG: beta/gamma crystallin-related protein [Usitatibacter sp.]
MTRKNPLAALIPVGLALCTMIPAAASAAEATLFFHPDFGGRQVTLRGYTPNLGDVGFQDQASSLVVHSGMWELCTQPEFKGDCTTLGPGEYRSLNARLNHRIESAREIGSNREQTGSYSPYGRGSIELFGQPGMGGRSIKLDSDAPALQGTRFNNRASSLVVTAGTWQLCAEPNYGGTCRIYPPGQYADLGYGMAKEVSSARLVRSHREAPVVLAAPTYDAPAAVAPGTRVILFARENFRGESIALSEPNAALRRAGFDDAAASMVIEGGRWLICSEAYFRGECKVMNPGRYPRLGAVGLQRDVSSLRPVGGPAPVVAARANPNAHVELFSEPDFGGRVFAAKRDVSNLGPTDFNDRASSIVIYDGQWEMCTDGEYGGRCIVMGPGRYGQIGGLTRQLSSLRRVR